jgi:hypothetical protein
MYLHQNMENINWNVFAVYLNLFVSFAWMVIMRCVFFNCRCVHVWMMHMSRWEFCGMFLGEPDVQHKSSTHILVIAWPTMTSTHPRIMSNPSLPGIAGVELRFSRHSPDWRVTQNFYSPNQWKTRQNHVLTEHLYSVQFVCTSPTRKIDHHDFVYVIIINESPCQVCGLISESGRNKTQLAGEKSHWEEEKNTRQAGE